MPDDGITSATPETPEEAETVAEDSTTEVLPDWAQKELERARKEAAKYRTRVRELEPFEVQAREAEEANKTELQRVTEQLEQYRAQAQEAQSALLRQEVAAAKGLTPAQARRLVGATKEELEADADDLLSVFSTPEPDSGTPKTRPTERLRGGRVPAEETLETDPAKLAEMCRRPGF